MIIAYKLVRKLSDGKFYPLFIDKHRQYIIGEKRYAEYIPTKGFKPRKGFHCCIIPYAPHLKPTLSNGERRVWVECAVDDIEIYNRPESQGGAWILAQELIINRELTFDEVDLILKDFKMKGIDDEKLEEILTDNGLDGTAFFTGDNFSGAILGYTENGNLVYSYEKMIEWLMDVDEISSEDAQEYIDYNVIRTVPYMGETKPIIVYALNY